MNLSKTGEYDITEALNLMLKNKKIIQNFTCDEFIDCGTLDGLLNGLSFIVSKIPNLSYVSNDCILGTNVIIEQNVSIGKNCRIGNNVRLSNCILLDNTSIDNNKEIKNMVIGGNKILNDCS